MTEGVRPKLGQLTSMLWKVALVSLVLIWIADLTTSAIFIKLGYPQLEGNILQRAFVSNPSAEEFVPWITSQWAWVAFSLLCLLPWLQGRLFGQASFSANILMIPILYATWNRLTVGVAGNLGTIGAIIFGSGLPISATVEGVVGTVLETIWFVAIGVYFKRTIRQACGDNHGEWRQAKGVV